MQPCPQDGLSIGLPCADTHFHLYVEFALAIGRQGQFFRLARLLGEETGGLKTPGYYKDRPSDGKRSGCAAPFQTSAHSVSQVTVYGLSYIAQPVAV